jgi:putative FmdB family regulatory protein
MPTYVYRCIDCQYERDIRHPMTDDPAICCAVCDGYCERVPQPTGISLRGKGFYKNDTATEGL